MSTRDKLVKVAHDLFYSQGFHAVGIDQILNEVGVTKTTFYHHFESKDDLMLETLRWHDRWWQSTFRQMLRTLGGDTPKGQLLALPDFLQSMIDEGNYYGCIFINVAVQYPLAHDPAHIMAAEHKTAMEDLLRELAGYAGAPEPAALARELAIVLEGAYVTLQVSGNSDAIETSRNVIQGIVQRHLES